VGLLSEELRGVGLETGQPSGAFNKRAAERARRAHRAGLLHGSSPVSRAPQNRNGPYKSNDLFRRIATHTSHGVGSPWSFVVALGVVIVWAVSGPVFGFSDTWQLVINTGTTIVTFLMVFLIQNTQNRDSHALHLKLDELIRASSLARNQLMALEDLTDDELEDLQHEFDRLAKQKIAERSRTSHHHHQQHGGASKTPSSKTGTSGGR
jgi:low affinity Fe/Cu permease